MTDCCLCVCLRPSTFRRLIDDTYPKGTSGFEPELAPQKVSRLTDYAVQYPRKLPSIAQYLEQRIARDYRKGRLAYVRLGLFTFNALVAGCHQQATLEFIEPHIARSIIMLLESSDPRCEAMAVRAVIDYANECEDSADATPFIKPVIQIVQKYSRAAHTDRQQLILALEALLKLIEVLISNNAAQLEANMRAILDAIMLNMRRESLPAITEHAVQEITTPIADARRTTERRSADSKVIEEKDSEIELMPHSKLQLSKNRSSSLPAGEEHDPVSLGRECVVFMATASSPSTILKLLSTLFTIFDEKDWDDVPFVMEVLELVATSSESVNAYHLPIFHHLLCHLGVHLAHTINDAMSAQARGQRVTADDPEYQRHCRRNNQILTVVSEIINAASGEMPVHSLFEEDLHNLLLQVLDCVLHYGELPAPVNGDKIERKASLDYAELPLVQQLIDSVFRCISALAIRLPLSVDRVEVLNVMMTFLDQQGSHLQEEFCQKRLISYVLKAAVVMLTQSADIFGEDKVCPNFVVYKLIMLLQLSDPKMCDEAADVLLQLLAWRSRCAQTPVVRVHVGLEHTDVQHWRPFTFLQTQYIRAGIYLAATQWNGVMQHDKIVSVSRLVIAMVRAYGVREVLESLCVVNGICKFWSTYEIDGLTGEAFEVAVELLTSLRFLVIVYFRTVAEVLSSQEVRNVTDKIYENWKRYGALPSWLSLDGTDIRKVNAPRTNNPPVLRRTHPEHEKLQTFDKATILPALLQSSKLAEYAIQLRQAFDEDYRPPRDLGNLLKDDVLSPRMTDTSMSVSSKPGTTIRSSEASSAAPRRSSMRIETDAQDSLQALMRTLDTTEVPQISSRTATLPSAYDARLRIPVL